MIFEAIVNYIVPIICTGLLAVFAAQRTQFKNTLAVFKKHDPTFHKQTLRRTIFMCIAFLGLLLLGINYKVVMHFLAGEDIYWRQCLPTHFALGGESFQAYKIVNGTGQDIDMPKEIKFYISCKNGIHPIHYRGMKNNYAFDTNTTILMGDHKGKYTNGTDPNTNRKLITVKYECLPKDTSCQFVAIWAKNNNPCEIEIPENINNIDPVESRNWCHRHPKKTYFLIWGAFTACITLFLACTFTFYVQYSQRKVALLSKHKKSDIEELLAELHVPPNIN